MLVIWLWLALPNLQWEETEWKGGTVEGNGIRAESRIYSHKNQTGWEAETALRSVHGSKTELTVLKKWDLWNLVLFPSLFLIP